jgi:hypothetical protein
MLRFSGRGSTVEDEESPGLQPFLGLYLAFGVIMISIHLYDEKKVRKAERPFCHGKVDGVLEIDKKVDD